jgi:ribosome-associated protein
MIARRCTMTFREVKIHTEYIKLDQLLKFADVTSSGGEARIFVEEGFVEMNGEVVSQRGRKIYKGMQLTVRIPGEEPIEIRVKLGN